MKWTHLKHGGSFGPAAKGSTAKQGNSARDLLGCMQQAEEAGQHVCQSGRCRTNRGCGPEKVLPQHFHTRTTVHLEMERIVTPLKAKGGQWEKCDVKLNAVEAARSLRGAMALADQP